MSLSCPRRCERQKIKGLDLDRDRDRDRGTLKLGFAARAIHCQLRPRTTREIG